MVKVTSLGTTSAKLIFICWCLILIPTLWADVENCYRGRTPASSQTFDLKAVEDLLHHFDLENQCSLSMDMGMRKWGGRSWNGWRSGRRMPGGRGYTPFNHSLLHTENQEWHSKNITFVIGWNIPVHVNCWDSTAHGMQFPTGSCLHYIIDFITSMLMYKGRSASEFHHQWV